MKLRQYLTRGAWTDIGLLLLMLALVVTGQVHDTFGWVVAGMAVLFFSYRAYRRFEQAKVTRDEESAYGPPSDATPGERASYYKRLMWIGAIAFPIIAADEAYDLYRLESGSVVSVRLDGATAFLYEHFGPWVAGMLTPLLGVLVVVGMVYMLKRNKEGRDLPGT